MKSKRALFKTLDEYRGTGMLYQDKGLKAPRIGDETYGRQSFIYIGSDNVASRKALEDHLTNEGFKVSRKYWPGSSVSEVQVSYFKGRHWNE